MRLHYNKVRITYDQLDEYKKIVNDYFGFNIFFRTRRRKYTNARSIFYGTLQRYYKLQEINGCEKDINIRHLSTALGFNHANTANSLTKFHNYFKEYKKDSDKLLNKFITAQDFDLVEVGEKPMFAIKRMLEEIELNH